ncbi:hypothetical protein A2U01_0030009, partial [Trifolium medium]|nr:hypothetical protein [Trifolium medium]
MSASSSTLSCSCRVRSVTILSTILPQDTESKRIGDSQMSRVEATAVNLSSISPAWSSRTRAGTFEAVFQES